MGGALGFGGTLKPGMGAIFLDRMGEEGLLGGYAACMYVEMWVGCSRRYVELDEKSVFRFYLEFYTRPVGGPGTRHRFERT